MCAGRGGVTGALVPCRIYHPPAPPVQEGGWNRAAPGSLALLPHPPTRIPRFPDSPILGFPDFPHSPGIPGSVMLRTSSTVSMSASGMSAISRSTSRTLRPSAADFFATFAAAS